MLNLAFILCQQHARTLLFTPLCKGWHTKPNPESSCFLFNFPNANTKSCWGWDSKESNGKQKLWFFGPTATHIFKELLLDLSVCQLNHFRLSNTACISFQYLFLGSIQGYKSDCVKASWSALRLFHLLLPLLEGASRNWNYFHLKTGRLYMQIPPWKIRGNALRYPWLTF